MLVSWNWLKQYVELDMTVEELQRRLTFSGLNHESTAEQGGDLAIDLEVTSNRPDCLCHIGIAREIAVLFGKELKLPAAAPRESATPVEKLVAVRIECPDLCLRYTARVIRGVKIGPSPRWLARRLETIGITPINNVVDISNYVLMECGQPLHTFDFGRLEGQKGTGTVCAQHPPGRSAANGTCPLLAEIVVRRPRPGETIEAIDHKTYTPGPDSCLICDARRPVAIGGVMGGAQTEISPRTIDVLVESAEFDPLSIRNTARLLGLHSDSSYRFERRVDPEGLDWASRRCCELILELAGGELAGGVVDVGRPPPTREPITLRFDQLRRILGIDVPGERAREILLALGNEEVMGAGDGGRGTGDDNGMKGEGRREKGDLEPKTQDLKPKTLTVLPPSWRRDLTREIDLIEEVGRIFGYESVPEDVGVPMVPSARRREDRVLERVRNVLTACGFDEAVTPSMVDQQTAESFSPWTDAPPLRSQMPLLRGADRLRLSLVPSLLTARRTNESLGNADCELFEIARSYLPQGTDLPREELCLAIVGSEDYALLKGVVETVFAELKIAEPPTAAAGLEPLDPAAACRWTLDGQMLGYAGRLTAEAVRRFELRGPAAVAEIRLAPLMQLANLAPRAESQSPYPAIERDLNLVVDEAVHWADLAATVRTNGGQWLESLDYRDTYRDVEKLGVGRKSLLFAVSFRRNDGTLTGQQADIARDQIIAACRAAHGAELRA